MLQIKDLNYAVGDLQLLQQINWVIKPGRRIGLIGPNGAGKTTMFRLIIGHYTPESGQISFPKNYKIGYLPQEEINFDSKTILAMVMDGHQELVDIEQEMYILHQKLENHPGQQDLVNRLGYLEDHYNILGGYSFESSAKKVLQGLGFKETDFHRSIREFSGGWRMRAHLARLLLQEPDLLLMDEPTNHLDLKSLEWLEDYLQNFPGTIITVSHDRYFLDRIVNEIAELENRKLKTYAGNFHFYEQKKELENEQLVKAFEAQQAEIKRIQIFIDRFRYKNTKATQVQSRVKMLEKMEMIELPKESKGYNFRIQADTKSFKEVLTIKNLTFAYDENPVIKDLDLTIERGEKIALVGENGEGKTTLTKLMYGDLIAQHGLLKRGERVNIGYYAQHQVDSLNINRTVYDEVQETAAPSFRPRLRDILGLFRFHGDDVTKKIAVLSGGEKARVSLAKILLSPCNFLIMDEPTNHLDVASKEALEHALRHYDGTLLVISHDRYFLDQLVNRVIEIKEGNFFDYPGNYSYYLTKRKQYSTVTHKQEESFKDPATNGKLKSPNYKSKEQKRQEALARQEISKQRNLLQKQIIEIEKRLETLTLQKSYLENKMADVGTYNDPQIVADTNKLYKKTNSEISDFEKRWEEKQMELDQLLDGLHEDYE